MLEVLVPTGVTVVGAVIYYCVRTENRITRIETKMDALLKKNGINPDSYNSKKEK